MGSSMHMVAYTPRVAFVHIFTTRRTDCDARHPSQLVRCVLKGVKVGVEGWLQAVCHAHHQQGWFTTTPTL